MTGGRQAHPLLISLANIVMDFRMKASNHAFLLLALLPISKFIHKNRKTRSILENRMIHECLDFILKPLKKAAEVGIMMSDPLGFRRYAFTPLAAYIVDVQEALALSGIAGKTSHITMATYKEFGDPFQHEPRMASTTLARLHAIEETVSPWDLAQYIKASNAHRLNGVHRPFWRDWPLSEPSTFFTPEALHHWHKMFWDHDAKWCIHAVGGAEIDFRFAILHPHTSFRQFNEGISRLKQVTGREHRDIQRYIIPVIADAIPKDFLIAIRSLMDFRYLAQAPEISDQMCTEIDTALEEFHDYKHAIISAGARTGKGNRVIDNWFIPKLELLQSVTSNIRENGVAIQWSADVTERCHVTEVKDPSHGNNQEYESQICRCLDRADKCRRFDIATAIREARIDFRFLTNDRDPLAGNNDDDDGLYENPEEDPLSIISTTATLITQIRPAAPVTGTIRRNADYFELADALQQDLYPHLPLPFRTMAQGNTALHLTRDPTMKTMSVEDVIKTFNLPDLRGALADFLTRLNNNDPFHIGGRRIGNLNSPLPFDDVQVWTKVQAQNRSYFPPHHVLRPQSINASPPSGSWTYGHSDVVLINTDDGKVWPHSGLEGWILSVYSESLIYIEF
jgi:Plavaka transposase